PYGQGEGTGIRGLVRSVAGAGQELARGWPSAERDAAADQFGRAANALIRDKTTISTSNEKRAGRCWPDALSMGVPLMRACARTALSASCRSLSPHQQRQRRQ